LGLGMDLLDPLSACLNIGQIAWSQKCRTEDLEFLEMEREFRRIDDARRQLDEKVLQLKMVSWLSALVGSFGMVVLTEITIPPGVEGVLINTFGISCILVVCTMLFAMLNCTLMLVAILKYDCIKRPVEFEKFWRRRCAADWKVSFKAFLFGLMTFSILIAQIGWVAFVAHPSRILAASCLTGISLVSGMVWLHFGMQQWKNLKD